MPKHRGANLDNTQGGKGSTKLAGLLPDRVSLQHKGVYPLWISVNGWTIEIDGKQIGVSKIGALLFYKTGLEKIRV